MSSIATTRRRRILASGALVAALVLAVVVPGASAAEPVPVLTVTTPEFELRLASASGNPLQFGNQGEGAYFVAEVENLSDTEQSFGLALNLRDPAIEQRLWLPEEWSANPDSDADSIAAFFTLTVDPHSIARSELDGFLPDLPGETYGFYRIAIDGVTLAEPELVGSYTTSGRHLPIDIDIDSGQVDFGALVEFSGTEVFPGVTATASAVGLLPGDSLGLWLTPRLDYFSFIILGAVLPTDAVPVGSGVVGPDGRLDATFVVPPTLAYGSYQLMVGDPVGRIWPAGSVQPLRVSPPAQGADAATPAGTAVAVSVPLGPTSVEFVFGTVTSAGVTTATSSATGPTPSGFVLPSNPALYYHLDTTATFAGTVQVCISYDPAIVTGGPLELYHYSEQRSPDGTLLGYQWRAITSSRSLGLVCGLTDSFSPFTLGVPTGIHLASKEQCQGGGWATSTLPAFRNQGACVSHFASARK